MLLALVLPLYRDKWCAGQKEQAHVSGTIGAFRLEKLDTENAPPPPGLLHYQHRTIGDEGHVAGAIGANA